MKKDTSQNWEQEKNQIIRIYWNEDE